MFRTYLKPILCLSKQSKELNENTRGDLSISPSKPLSTSCMSVRTRLVPRTVQATVRTPCCLDNAIDELFLKVNSLKIVSKYSRNLDTQ